MPMIEIDYEKIHHITDPLANRPYRLDPGEQDWLSTHMAWEIFIGKVEPPEPVKCKVYMGGMLADFLWTGLPPLLCVSKRVIGILESNDIRGWKTFPVEIQDKQNCEIPGYVGFSVTSCVGERDISQSEVVNKPPIVPKGKPYSVYRGLYFNKQKWDGSDIFRVAGAFILSTEKVAKLFKKHKVNNIRIIPIKEVETDVPISKKKDESKD